MGRPNVGALRGVSKFEFAVGGALEGNGSVGDCRFPLPPGMKASVPALVVPWVAVRKLPPGAPMPEFRSLGQCMLDMQSPRTPTYSLEPKPRHKCPAPDRCAHSDGDVRKALRLSTATRCL